MNYTLSDILRLVQKTFETENFLLQPTELYAPIDYTLSLGGKRIRPALLLAACYMTGGDPQKARNAALAIEVFHNFTLLHDDLMDQSPLRRGHPTVYRKWDANTAILSGDAMLILAYQYLAKQEQATSQQLLSTFNHMATEVMQGQQHDINFEKRIDVSPDEYIDMIYLKTAALLNGALHLGAIIGGASKQMLDQMLLFGRHIGLAFQLQDDLLDTFGDLSSFGKKPGQDILDNKKTMLLISALNNATQQQHTTIIDLLDNHYQNQNIDNERKIDLMKSIYIDTKAKQQVEDLIDKHYTIADQTLSAIDVDETHKKPMQELMTTLIKRNR